MKTWSRDNPMSTELEHYVFELKSKRTGNEKVKDTSDMVPPAQGGMVAGSVIHGCGGGKGWGQDTASLHHLDHCNFFITPYQPGPPPSRSTQAGFPKSLPT